MFGLTNIAAGLTRPDIQFHMADSRSHARISLERVNPDTCEEVPWGRMVKGHEHDYWRFILLTAEDLEEAQPGFTKTIVSCPLYRPKTSGCQPDQQALVRVTHSSPLSACLSKFIV